MINENFCFGPSVVPWLDRFWAENGTPFPDRLIYLDVGTIKGLAICPGPGYNVK